MIIVVASDKYKGSLSATRVCNIISKTIRKLDPSVEVRINPMADGGEGTVETLVESLGGKIFEADVMSPLGDNIRAGFGIIGDMAVIEMSAASGYILVPENKKNPMLTTTYGTGQLINKALEMGAKKIIVGIGGSATNDAGMGMAQALGYEFIGVGGQLLGYGGRQLAKLEKINTVNANSLLEKTEIEVASDVKNPLYGKRGAAYVYGPQKGADPDMVEELDRGLKNFARVVSKEMGIDLSGIPGAGAAGGLGAGLIAFAGAKIRPGTDIVAEITGLEKKIKGADLVITGEGSFDRQTFYGKSPYGVAEIAFKHGVPAISINGSILAGREDIKKEKSSMFCGNFSIIKKPMKLEEAVRNAPGLLEDITTEVISFYLSVLKNRDHK
jgi:glycerate 2-kinase